MLLLLLLLPSPPCRTSERARIKSRLADLPPTSPRLSRRLPVFKMSSDLQWLLLRKANSFIVKRAPEGPVFSTEPVRPAVPSSSIACLLLAAATLEGQPGLMSTRALRSL